MLGEVGFHIAQALHAERGLSRAQQYFKKFHLVLESSC